jgi:hypothetical protein
MMSHVHDSPPHDGNSAGIRSADALYYGTLVLHSFFLGANDDATTLSSAVGFRCARSP